MKALYLLFAIVGILGNTISLDAQDWTNKTECEAFLNAREKVAPLDPIEGIWAMSYDVLLHNQRKKIISETPNEYVAELVIVKDEDGQYGIYDLEGKPAYFDLGFDKASLPGQYLFKVKYPDTKTSAGAEAVFGEDGRLLFTYRKPTEQLEKEMGRGFRDGMYAIFDHRWLKLFPEREHNVATSKPPQDEVLTSSSAFLLSERYGIAVVEDIPENAKIRLADAAGHHDFANVTAFQKETGLLVFELNANAIHKELGENIYPLSKRVPALGEELLLLLSAKKGDQTLNHEYYGAEVSSKLGNDGELDRFVLQTKGDLTIGAFAFNELMQFVGIEVSGNDHKELHEFFHAPKVMESLARVEAEQAEASGFPHNGEDEAKREALAELLKQRIFILEIFR